MYHHYSVTFSAQGSQAALSLADSGGNLLLLDSTTGLVGRSVEKAIAASTLMPFLLQYVSSAANLFKELDSSFKSAESGRVFNCFVNNSFCSLAASHGEPKAKASSPG